MYFRLGRLAGESDIPKGAYKIKLQPPEKEFMSTTVESNPYRVGTI